MSELSLPPLFRGAAAPDPFARAVEAGRTGCDPGLIVHDEREDRACAAIVLAPQCPLEDAMAMVFACSLAFSDALGALAPPETAAHLAWPNGLLVNGALCGGVRAAAATPDPAAEPDWLVVGFEAAFAAEDENPGLAPERTTLREEGCGDIRPAGLIESWSRHMLFWINHWLEDGMARLHADWTGRAHGLGEAANPDLNGERLSGIFLGIDERGGMLLREGARTRLIPLSAMLED